MKKFISKLALSACVAATSLFAAGIASAEGTANWGGLYAGGHVGYGIVDQGFDFGEDDGDKYKRGRYVYKWKYETDNDADGFAGGAHVGYNHQTGKFVIGIEGDFSKTTSDVGYKYKEVEKYKGDTLYKYKQNLNIDVDYLASLRARVGYAQDNLLMYLTAGVAWTKVDWNFQAKEKEYGYTNYNFKASGSDSLTGFVVGGGGEYMLADGFSVRGEVLHYVFDEKIDGEDFDLDSTVARVGFSMKIN